MNSLDRIPCAYLLLAIMVVVFIMEESQGSSQSIFTARKFGAMYGPDLQKGKWYELITSMFVHFGVGHIACNAYALYYLGPAVQRLFGSQKFLIIYFVSGIAGNLLTYYMEKREGCYKVSAGASGAIFGLFGVFAMMAVLPQYRPYVNVASIVRSLIINLGIGFASKQINMKAHLGGLAAGMVLTFIMLNI